MKVSRKLIVGGVVFALVNTYRTVTMTAELGAPDTDHEGRLLRFVQIDSEDFGEDMGKYDHTSVYQDGNDASCAYVQHL